MLRNLVAVADLLKLRVSLAVVLSMAVGFVMAAHQANTLLVALSAGVLFTAMGSAVINHAQEYRRDLLMPRTRKRPVPTGVIAPGYAYMIGTLLAATGLITTWVFAGILPTALTLTTLIMYNVIYTPLKKVTPYALLAGSLVGAIPPAIGYTAADGSLLNPHLLAVSIFFFIWQIPHFMLLLLKYGDEYLMAGFKTLNRYLSTRILSMVTLIWLTALAVAALILVPTGVITHTPYVLILILSSITLILSSLPILQPTKHQPLIPRMFRWINLFMVLVAHLIMFQHLYYPS